MLDTDFGHSLTLPDDDRTTFSVMLSGQFADPSETPKRTVEHAVNRTMEIANDWADFTSIDWYIHAPLKPSVGLRIKSRRLDTYGWRISASDGWCNLEG